MKKYNKKQHLDFNKRLNIIHNNSIININDYQNKNNNIKIS